MDRNHEALDLLEEVASILGKAGRELMRRAPGALAGAAKGFMVGGPGGALLGGAVGAAKSGNSEAPTSATILTLLATLLRPEVVQALKSIATGGATTVPVAGVKVPVASFANLIQTLAGRAVGNPRGGVFNAEHLMPMAEAGGNPSNSDDRAAALLALLVEAESEDEVWASRRAAVARDRWAIRPDDVDEYDELAESLDLAEIDRLGGID